MKLLPARYATRPFLPGKVACAVAAPSARTIPSTREILVRDMVRTVYIRRTEAGKRKTVSSRVGGSPGRPARRRAPARARGDREVSGASNTRRTNGLSRKFWAWGGGGRPRGDGHRGGPGTPRPGPRGGGVSGRG